MEEPIRETTQVTTRESWRKTIRVNGAPLLVEAATLARLIVELDYDDAAVATALNQNFVRRKDRADARLAEGDEVEILTPRQGG